jgi:hypothetical protein
MEPPAIDEQDSSRGAAGIGEDFMDRPVAAEVAPSAELDEPMDFEPPASAETQEMAEATPDEPADNATQRQ